jgi:hypothetical protein
MVSIQNFTAYIFKQCLHVNKNDKLIARLGYALRLNI